MLDTVKGDPISNDRTVVSNPLSELNLSAGSRGLLEILDRIFVILVMRNQYSQRSEDSDRQKD